VEHIVAKLREHGAPADRPAGIVVHGTTARQRVITATLATLAEAAAGANLESPALLIVGDVVALHSSLAWFGAASSESETEADLSQTA
jgi:uroporphyrin-III C-methyltransferase / precorrin-2 dehydrogenase / sirohydrochlorin ferrochelatase